jgi:hypothetical protein
MNPYKMLFEDPKYKKFTTVIGSFIIIGAMAGIFAHEAEAYADDIVDLDSINLGSFGSSVYQIDWEVRSPKTLTESGSNDATVNFDISQRNLTSVNIVITWTDDNIGPNPFGLRDDTISISVTAPGLEGKSKSGTSGEESVSYTVNNAPASVQDVSSGDVDDNLETHMSEAGMGEWTVSVDVQPEGLTDTGNSWSLSVSYSWYEGVVSEMTEE